MHLLHGVRKTSLHSPLPCGQGAGPCVSVLSRSAPWCGPGQRKAGEGFPVVDSRSLPCASCLEPPAGQASQPGPQHNSRTAVPGTLTHWSPLRLGPEDVGTHTAWPWHVEGSLQLWLHYLSCFLVSGWTVPSAPPGVH